jgi:outer membrane protein assembly factor BamA
VAVLVSVCTVAQQTSPNKFRLVNVTATGSTHYSQSEILAASGLVLNSQVSQQDMQQGANRLGTSGAFSAVHYEYLPTGIGGRDATVAFQLTDNPQMLPVVYENLVWFKPADLDRELRNRVPLFHSQLPEAGTLQDEVINAVQQLLQTRGVQTKVTAELNQAHLGAAISGVALKAETSVRVTAVKFTGNAAVSTPELQAASATLLQQPYGQSFLTSFCNSTLRRLYLQRGFLKVGFGDFDVSLESAPQSAAVEVTIPIAEGDQYKFAGVTFSGNSAISEPELRKLIKLQPGQPANTVDFQKDLAGMKTLYGGRGYMAASYTLKAHLNEDRTAMFDVAINEGDQYHMGKLEVTGADASLAAKLAERWKLAPGAVYDDSYRERYSINVATLLQQPRRYQIRFIERMDDANKVVNVTLQAIP